MQLTLTNGHVVLIDAVDVMRVLRHKWYAHKPKNSKTFYAVRNVTLASGKHTMQMLHRFILDLEGIKIMVDHKNGDGLDCRRANLRKATPQENTRNRGRQKNNTSFYRGVSFDARRNKYRARIKVSGKEKWLGYFSTAQEASERYETEAKLLFGEFYRPLGNGDI